MDTGVAVVPFKVAATFITRLLLQLWLLYKIVIFFLILYFCRFLPVEFFTSFASVILLLI